MENSESRVTVRKLRLSEIIAELKGYEELLLNLELRVEDCPELSAKGQDRFGARVSCARQTLTDTRGSLMCVEKGDISFAWYRASAEEKQP